MFTVRYIESDGNEYIWQAKSVRVYHFPNDPDPAEKRQVTIFKTDGECEDLRTGDIYVMNEAGKTVADYHLGFPPQVYSSQVETTVK